MPRGQALRSSAARVFSGSHQSRLSRYHSTVSARPFSNGTCGA